MARAHVDGRSLRRPGRERGHGRHPGVEEVAEAVIAGLREERFLIFPHPRVADYYAKKAAQPEKWLRRMAVLQEQFS